jgi:cytochrome c nitrite reductase small subunit
MGRFIASSFGVWFVIALIVGGLAGLGLYTFAYAEGGSYFSDEASACANCHVMREYYDGWMHGSHQSVANCNDCHTPHEPFIAKYATKGTNGFNHSKAFTLDDYPSNFHITEVNREIAADNCLRCHAELVSFVVHQDQKHPTDCLACHVGIGHGR